MAPSCGSLETRPWLHPSDEKAIKRLKAKKARKQKQQQAKVKKQKTEQIKSAYSKELKDKATPAEKKFLALLTKHKIAVLFQKPWSCGEQFYITDFYLKDYQTVVELDGGYHNDPEQIAKDQLRTERLLAKNSISRVIRFDNEEVEDEQGIMVKLLLHICPFAQDFIR